VCVYYIGMCIFFTLCTCIDVYYIVVGILKRAGALLGIFSGFVPPERVENSGSFCWI
jgi:hypothetical protein